jgi:hypothetical protein
VANARHSPPRSPSSGQLTPPDSSTPPSSPQLSDDRNDGPADSAGSISSGSSAAETPTQPDVLLVPSLPPPLALEPCTRLQKGIKHPKIYTNDSIRYGMLTYTGEPHTLAEALQNNHWRNAMCARRI